MRPSRNLGRFHLRSAPQIAIGAAIFLAIWPFSPAPAFSEDDYRDDRAQMIRVIVSHALYTSEALPSQRIDDRVLEVMGRVPRHRFVPKLLRDQAYEDRPLPIGHGQTISQPFIVAVMTHLVDPDPQDRVLEIGTGSGYQAAILAELADVVCSIEIVPGLGQSAARRLKELRYANIRVKVADGYYGWPDCGPFDGIVVTAASSHVPPPLIEQLKAGGRMVIPVSGAFVFQHLVLVEKHDDGSITTRQLLPVRFVPLTRQRQ